MARPLLADPEFVIKTAELDDEINTCIACNQACLDHTFKNRCLLNPRAGHETELVSGPARRESFDRGGRRRTGGFVGGDAASRGHRVTCSRRATTIGGQFNLALRVPGKEEFSETIRYFRASCSVIAWTCGSTRVLHANRRLRRVIVATGIVHAARSGHRRQRPADCADLRSMCWAASCRSARSVAVIGAGGIGFDVSEFLLHQFPASRCPAEPRDAWLDEWGVDLSGARARGGLKGPLPVQPVRDIWLLQRTRGGQSSARGSARPQAGPRFYAGTQRRAYARRCPGRIWRSASVA